MSSSLTFKVHETKYSEFLALVFNKLCTVSSLHCYFMEYLQSLAISWNICSSLPCYLKEYWNFIVAKFYLEIYCLRFIWLKVLLFTKHPSLLIQSPASESTIQSLCDLSIVFKGNVFKGYFGSKLYYKVKYS